MRGNLLGILFTVLSGVLIFLTVFAYSRSDRTPPEFRFSSVDLVYDSGTRDNDLRVGVNAFDNRDGDLSGRIVVEKVVLNREKETAVVYYAVADLSGNVTKQSRVFPANIDDLENNGAPEEAAEIELTPDLLEEEGIQAPSEGEAADSVQEASGESAEGAGATP